MWPLLVWWILASAAGFALGAVVSFVVYQINNDDLFVFIAVGVGIAVGGIVAATLQMPVLLRYSCRWKRWAAVNTAGGVGAVVIYFATGVTFDLVSGDPVGWAELGNAMVALLVMVIVSPIVGSLLGVLQWVALGRRIGRPDRWVFANAIGYGTGWVASTFVGFLLVVWLFIGDGYLDWGLLGAVFGTVYGLFSRSVLTKLAEVDALDRRAR